MRMRGWWHIELGACRACIIRPTASKRARVRSLAFVINITQQLPTPTRPNAPTYAHQLSFLSAFHVAFRNFLASVARQKRRRETPLSSVPPLPPLDIPQHRSKCKMRTPYATLRISRIPLYVLLCIIDAFTLPAPTPTPLCLHHSPPFTYSSLAAVSNA